jgi:hypothetical protein
VGNRRVQIQGYGESVISKFNSAILVGIGKGTVPSSNLESCEECRKSKPLYGGVAEWLRNNGNNYLSQNIQYLLYSSIVPVQTPCILLPNMFGIDAIHLYTQSLAVDMSGYACFRPFPLYGPFFRFFPHPAFSPSHAL